MFASAKFNEPREPVHSWPLMKVFGNAAVRLETRCPLLQIVGLVAADYTYDETLDRVTLCDHRNVYVLGRGLRIT
jgi:hypothetical protein